MRRCETDRNWAGVDDIDALTAKADVLDVLSVMGTKVDNLQLAKPTADYWHPGRSGRLQMGPKNILADFGELHPGKLKQLGIEGRVVAFEIWPENLPAPRKKSAKGADKQLITDVSLFDVYQGQGVEDGHKSLAIDVTISPKETTLTDKDIETVSDKIVAQVGKAGGTLRG